MNKYRRMKSKVLVTLLLIVYLCSSLGVDALVMTGGRYLEAPPENTGQDEGSPGTEHGEQSDGITETGDGEPLISTGGSPAVDPIVTFGEDPGEGSGDEAPIEFSYWEISDDGVISQYNRDWFYLAAAFLSTEEIISIDYAFSSDGTNWRTFNISSDYGLQQYGEQWKKLIYADMDCDYDGTYITDGSYTLRAIASTASDTLTVDRTIIIDTTAPDATNLTVAPNDSNTGLVLSWTNPDYDFERAGVFRWYSYGSGGWFTSFDDSPEDIWESPDGSSGYWRELVDTTDDTYTDLNVDPNTTYYYMVFVYDQYDNQSSDPPRVTGKLADQPIYLKEIYTADVNSDNADNFNISASFIPLKVIVDETDLTLEIESIEFKWSYNGTEWQDFSADMIVYSYELYFNDYYYYWSRSMYVDISGLPDGDYWIQATATDEEGNTLAATKPFTKDTVAEEVINLEVEPNSENDALVLTWDFTEDIYYATVYRLDYYSYSPNWRWVSKQSVYSESGKYSYSYIDRNVIPYRDYTYKIVAVDNHYNESTSPPEVTGRLHTDAEIAPDEMWGSNEEVISAAYDSSYSISAYFNSFKEINRIDYTYSANGGADWHDLTPFMSNRGAVYYYVSDGSGSRSITINVEGPLGWPDGSYIVRAAATDIDGNTCTSDLTLLKDTMPPANVTDLTAELNAEQTEITLSWVSPAEDFSYVDINRNGYTKKSKAEGNSYTDTTIQVGSVYTYQVYASDAYNNRNPDPVSVTVVVDGGGPVLSSMSPATELYIVFDESIRPGVNYDDIELTSADGDGSSIVIVNVISGNTLVIAPNDPMPFNSDMTLTIPAGAVADLFGNLFEGGRILNFTTTFIPDTTPPAVSSTYPADNDTNIPRNVQITVTFDEEVLEGDAFDLVTLAVAGGNTVSVAVTLTDTTLSIEPQTTLEYGKTYLLTLPVGVVVDEADNPQAEFSLSFRTEDDPPPPPPPPPSGGTSGPKQIIITEKDIEEEVQSVGVTEEDLQNGILITAGALQELADEGGVLEIVFPGCTMRIDGSQAQRILAETGDEGLLVGAPEQEPEDTELPDYLEPIGEQIQIQTSANATLIIPIGDVEDPWRLQVYVFNGTEWELAGGRIDLENGTIDVPIGEGVYYQLMEYTGEFEDTEEHWCEEGIVMMAARRIALGYPDGSFRPDNNVLRSEILSFLSRILSYIGYSEDNDEEETADEPAAFDDVSQNDWFAGLLDDVLNSGLMLGYPDGTFRPEEYMTREQAATTILRLLKLMGVTLPDVSDTDVLDSYSDSNEVSDWARESMEQAVSAGIMQGYNNQLNPQDPITRAELITIILRALDLAGILQV